MRILLSKSTIWNSCQHPQNALNLKPVQLWWLENQSECRPKALNITTMDNTFILTSRNAIQESTPRGSQISPRFLSGPMLRWQQASSSYRNVQVLVTNSDGMLNVNEHKYTVHALQTKTKTKTCPTMMSGKQIVNQKLQHNHNEEHFQTHIQKWKSRIHTRGLRIRLGFPSGPMLRCPQAFSTL